MNNVSSVKVSIASDPAWQVWTTSTTCDKLEEQLKLLEGLKVKDSFYQNCLAFDLKAFREIYSCQALQTKVANKLPAFKACVQTVSTEVQLLLAMHQARLRNERCSPRLLSKAARDDPQTQFATDFLRP